MTRFCEKCGAPLREGVNFCTKCGHPVTAQPQPSPQPRPQQPSRLNPQYRPKANPQPESRQLLRNSTFGLVMLGLVVMIVSAVAVVKFIDYRYDKQDATLAMASGQEEGGGGTTDAGGNGDEGSNSLLLTEETLKYLKEHPVEVTPENSPGNPDFIEVTYTEEEYANAPTCAALVTQDHPEVDFPELGVHVNMKSWNLEYEQDSLIVKRLPDKLDNNTGMILHSYDYSLVSKQHNFLTGVEFTAPVQGDPDAFAGFVTYNKATGRWEEVYCELSEDRRTFTAYLSHFSEGSALETVKKEGTEAIETFKIDGKSIFVQLKNEMKPKYEETQHYLYPVSIARTVDLKKFFNKQQKNQLEIINRIIVEQGNIPEKDAVMTALEWFGVGNDMTGNTAGSMSAAKDMKIGFMNVSSGPLGTIGKACTYAGIIVLTLNVSDQIVKDYEIGSIVENNWAGAVGSVVGLVGIWAPAGSLAATSASIICASLFAYTVYDAVVKELFKLKYPLGTPTSIAEAALQCYMEDYAHSDKGVLRPQLSAWDQWISGVKEMKIDSLACYLHWPQLILDCNEKNWLAAYDCLIKKNVNNPKQMFKDYDKMYELFVDAFWNEKYEVQKKYIRMACKKYIEVDMYLTDYYDQNKKKKTIVMSGAETFSVPEKIEFKLTPEGESEWREIQQDVVKHGNRLKEEERASKSTGYHTDIELMLSDVTWDDVWDAVFQDWDEKTGGERERKLLGDLASQKEFFHKEYIKRIQARVSPLLHDYYNKKRHESIIEVEKMLRNQVVPLLNTRLTFYSNNLEDPNGIYKPTNFGVPETPEFEFICDKKAQFRPGNAYEVEPCFPLELKPNEKNPVLLETTVYHYLMFNCPQEVKTSMMVDNKPIMAKTNWNKVTLVKDKNLAKTVNSIQGLEKGDNRSNQYAKREIDAFQKNVADTQIPIEFGMKSDEKNYCFKKFEMVPISTWGVPNLYNGVCLDKYISDAINSGQVSFDLPEEGDEFTIEASGKSNYSYNGSATNENENYDVRMKIKGYVKDDTGYADFTMKLIVKCDGDSYNTMIYDGNKCIERQHWVSNLDLIFDVEGHGHRIEDDDGSFFYSFLGEGKLHQKGTIIENERTKTVNKEMKTKTIMIDFIPCD